MSQELWTNLPDEGLRADTVQKYLRPIPDDLWVTAACVDKVVDDVPTQRCLLQLGIERTEPAIQRAKQSLRKSDDGGGSGQTANVSEHEPQTHHGSLVLYFRNEPTDAQLCRMRAVLLERLDRLNTFVEICKEIPENKESEVEEWDDDPWVDGATPSPVSTNNIANVPLSSFLTNTLVRTACLLASQQWFSALQIVFQRHATSLWPLRFLILNNIPEHAPPSLYCAILPAFDPSTDAELIWPSVNWRPVLDFSEIPEAKVTVADCGIWDDKLNSEKSPPITTHSNPLTAQELAAWYTDWVDRIISATGMVDTALVAIQYGASQGIPGLDELGEELSLLSRLVYDAPQAEDVDIDWTLTRWKSMDPHSVVQAYLAHSTPDTVAQDIFRLVSPYLFVLESRAERQGQQDSSLYNRLLYDYILTAPLDIAAAIFEASKPTLSANQRLIKDDEDIARLALACLYGSDSLNEWSTMSRIFECLPAWETPTRDEDEGDAADTTVTSMGAFLTPSTTRPHCTPSDLIVFFKPLPQTSLSRALDILDVHLESGEILSRWTVPAPLRWFLQSINDAAEQRAWANRLARRAGGSKDKLDTLDDWNWLLEDMLKLAGSGESGLRSAFGLLSRKEVIHIFFGGLLSTGNFSIAKALLQSSKNELSLDAEAIEDICLSCSRELYDNANSGNYKFGDMKLAYECLDVPTPPLSSRVIREKELIEATSRLSSFNVMSRPGVPISPIEIRLTKDRLSLVSRVLSSNADAYKHTEVMLDLVRKLGFRDDIAAEVKVLAMLADTAIQDEDFGRAYEVTKRMVDTVLDLRSCARSCVDDPKIQEVSEVCWVACFQLGRQPFSDVEKKLTLLGRALGLCPPDKLHDVLVAWRRLKKEDIANRPERSSRSRIETAAASSTKKLATSTVDSLFARLQDSRVPTSPSLKPPNAAAIASRTLKSVAASFPFSVTGRSSTGSEGGPKPDDDVSAQASRVLSKGIGWLIGDDS